MRRLLALVILATGLLMTSTATADQPPSTPPGWPTYSYYAAPPGFPARIYVGLGTVGDFPFYGQPYGRAYDRYSWSGMMGSPDPRLVRYYSPPLR
jgi:hypothetical protein